MPDEHLRKAADYNLTEEIGRSIIRLNDIFANSIANDDPKTALAAQKELHEVFQFKNRIAKLEEAAPINHEAEAIKRHLLPLKLAPEHVPLSEHVRVAAAKLSEM